MARATRSAVAHGGEKQELFVSLPMITKSPKKRKRTSLGETDEQPVAKQSKTEDTVLETDHEVETDEESIHGGTHGVEQEKEQEQEGSGGKLQAAGDSLLDADDAGRILDILEAIDTQGLLDRVFPLPSDMLPAQSSAPSSSKTKLSSASFSLRTMLQDSQHHTLRVIRAAVQQLYPISSQPRSRTSPTAAQQIQFCKLALSLIDQASLHTTNLATLDPDVITAEIDQDQDPPLDSPPVKYRKYALSQKLPDGEWWTSLNAPLGVDGADAVVKDLLAGHAELVSILPDPSSGVSTSVPTLGDIHIGRKIPAKVKPPGPRMASTGSFLDFGPYATFAPTYATDGCTVGQYAHAGVLYRKYEKGKVREKARQIRERMQSSRRDATAMDVDQDNRQSPARPQAVGPATGEDPLVPLIALEESKTRVKDLLGEPTDDSVSLDSALDSIQLEAGLNGLLRRNATALSRLKELQRRRFAGLTDDPSEIETEERELASSLTESLALIASLRPRSLKDSSSAIVPQPSIIRSLHRTLPTGKTTGYHGTLASSRAFALRDDSTIHIRAATQASLQNAAQSSTMPQNQQQTQPENALAAPSTPIHNYGSAAAATATPYQGYPGYGQYYGYGADYYAKTYGHTAYPVQNQHAHQTPYAGWYTNYQPPAAPPTPQPQPIGAAGTSGTMAYQAGAGATAYSAAAIATPTPVTRVVANTLTTNTTTKPTQNGWSTPGVGAAASSYAATLPPHLRPGAASGSYYGYSAPSTPNAGTPAPS